MNRVREFRQKMNLSQNALAKRDWGGKTNDQFD